MFNNLKKFDTAINEKLQDLDEKIKNFNKKGFLSDIEILLKNFLGFNDNIKDENTLHKWLYKDLNLEVGGLNYLSHGLGEWFRILFGNMEKFEAKIDIRKTELDAHEESYQEVLPTEINLMVCDWLQKPVYINISRMQSLKTSRDKINFSFEDIKLLRSVCNKIEEKENYHKYIKNSSKLLQEYLNESEVKKISLLCTSWGDYINEKGFSDYRKEKVFSEKKAIDFLFRTLTFYLFRTIHLKERYLRNDVKIIIIPFKDKGLKSRKIRNYGSFVGIFRKEISGRQLSELEYFFKYILLRLCSYELTSSNISRRDLVVVENIMRLCTNIGNVENLNIVGKELEKWLTEKHGILDKDVEYIKKNFIGCNTKFLNMLQDIKEISAEQKIEDDQYTFKKGIPIFLYSEPGLGKETIAKLCHLFSPRSINRDVLSKHLMQFSTEEIKKFNLEKKVDIIQNGQFNNEKWQKNKFFNFFPCHAGLLDLNNIDEILFGNEERISPHAGYFLKAHFFGGTVFIDEINTLRDRSLANVFLRVMADPYEIVPLGRLEPIRINVLTIFSSNEKPYELKKSGVNHAVITRITKNYFEIMPLRERKEDIALLINHLIDNYNQELINENEKIRLIEISGLKLLCELKWDNNYRGVQGFVDNLLLNRRQKKIKSDIVSFEEIIECIKRREIMSL